MIEYLTIMADYGDMMFSEKLENAMAGGWAVYNIWEHPQKKYFPSVKSIIVTLVRTKP